MRESESFHSATWIGLWLIGMSLGMTWGFAWDDDNFWIGVCGFIACLIIPAIAFRYGVKYFLSILLFLCLLIVIGFLI
jgi:hypothetical protein